MRREQRHDARRRDRERDAEDGFVEESERKGEVAEEKKLPREVRRWCDGQPEPAAISIDDDHRESGGGDEQRRLFRQRSEREEQRREKPALLHDREYPRHHERQLHRLGEIASNRQQE